jgi:hypothetical protein
MVICIIKSLIAWVVLVFLGNNLMGLILRGFLWSAPEIDAPTDRLAELLNRESNKLRITNAVMTVIPLIFAGALIFCAYYFWNVGLAGAAALVMIARVPDHLWQIRTGLKRTRYTETVGVAQRVGDVLFWIPLPLIWYSLCMWT